MPFRIRPYLPRRGALLFLIAILVPCAVLIALGVRTMRQERQLEEKRVMDEQVRLSEQVRQTLHSHLEQINLEAMTRTAANGAGADAVRAVSSVAFVVA